MPEKTARGRGAARASARSSPRGRNEVRIIGGEWRGRRVVFAPAVALRPTPDRVRETLFNWLQAPVRGSRCLDLFAGSGALGIEALSRGAASAVFVEKDRHVADQLRATLSALDATRGSVSHQDAMGYLAGTAQPFDIVFLDPPFQSGLAATACELLEARGWLAPSAWIYLEAPARAALPPLPANWTVVRSKRAGEVGYHLAQRGSPPGTSQDRS